VKQRLNCCLIALLIILGAGIPSARAQRTLEWYLKNKGAVSASDNKLVVQAEEVFQKVKAAADKPDGLDPKLLITPETEELWAFCLKDGGIILSLATLNLCYAAGAENSTGSARLAFVLGHEIAHLAKGDFWHANVHEFIKRAGSVEKGMAQYYDFNPDSGNVYNRELKADYFGMLYAFLAGYNPYGIIKDEDAIFFKEWLSRPAGKIASDERSYPSPELRAKQLLVTLENICSQIDIFELSLRLYQKGDYAKALAGLAHVKRIFPCREVLNNIGLVYLQKALVILDQLREARTCRFKLATVLDTEIRITKSSGIHSKTKAALKAEYKDAIAKAIEHFEQARKQDNRFLPVQVNLASAYIINENYSDALAILKKAMDLKADDLNVLSNYAVAMYLFGRREGIKTDALAIKKLKTVLQANPNHAGALYNWGRILIEDKQKKKACLKWQRFLAIEPYGRYAWHVEEFLGGPPKGVKDFETQYESSPPIEMGYINKTIRKQLEAFSKKEFDLDSLERTTLYTKGDIKVWAVNRFIQSVETPPEKELYISDITSTYGAPARIISAASGRRTYVYRQFALDIDKNQKVTKVIYFEHI